MAANKHYNEALKALQRALVEHRTGDLVKAEEALELGRRIIAGWIEDVREDNKKRRQAFEKRHVPPEERGNNG